MSQYSGCYLLHLYCDVCEDYNDNTKGQTLNQCLIDANNMGWRITKIKKHITKILCPKCHKKEV